MIVNGKNVCVVEEFRAEIARRLQRQVAAGAILLSFLRVIEAAGAVTGNAAEQIAVVMILAAEEFQVLGQLVRQADLMASGAKLGALMEWLEKSFLVKIGLGLDEL